VRKLKLGEAKGWSPKWVAGSLSAFALAEAIGMTGMVVSTAIGPIVFGILPDYNVSYSVIFTTILLASLLTTLNGLRRVKVTKPNG